MGWEAHRYGGGQSIQLGRFVASINWEENRRFEDGEWINRPGGFRASFNSIRSAHLFADAEQAKSIALKLAKKSLTDALKALEELP